MGINDEKSQEQVLRTLGMLMEEAPGSFSIVSSLEMTGLTEPMTKSRRLYEKLLLTQVPELLLENEAIKAAIEKNPDLVCSLLDLSAYPGLILGRRVE